MLHIGITGGIGSGKSTVAKMFARQGAIVIDADRLVRDLLSAGGEGAKEVAAAFGGEFLEPDGSADRKKLSRLVFGDPEARQKLEFMLHPLVVSRRRRILEEIRRDRGDSCVVLSEASLIFEAGTRSEFDGVILVTAPAPVKMQRLVAAGWDRMDAESRMTAQWPDKAKIPLADWVIDNGGDSARTLRQVETLWRTLDEKAHAAR